MKDASDNDSVGASISAETSSATENIAQILKVTAAPDVTIPLVTVTATQLSDEPALINNKDKKKKGKNKA
jgi:orotate phosphoribosyltransferase